MQYLVSVIDDTAGLATPEEDAAIDVFNDRLQAEGHWGFAGGLASWPKSSHLGRREVIYARLAATSGRCEQPDPPAVSHHSLGRRPRGKAARDSPSRRPR